MSNLKKQIAVGTQWLKRLIVIALLGSAAAVRADATDSFTATVNSPREKLSMDFGWRFHLGDAPDAGEKFDYPEVKNLSKTQVDQLGEEGALADVSDAVTKNLGSDVSFVQAKFDDGKWRELDLPHDWAVELPFDQKANYQHGFKPVGTGFPENSVGWYRKNFDLPAGDKGEVLRLEFDGVFRNSMVWLNGHCLGRHLSGYTGFQYDISQLANYGGKNELVVRVDASRFEGWFYEGAGIYRHVWLEKTAPVAIVPGGIFVWSEFPNNVPKGPVVIQLRTTVFNRQKDLIVAEVHWRIIGPDGQAQAGGAHESSEIAPGSEAGYSREIGFPSPILWSPENPKLYKLITTVVVNGKVVDQKETEFGIRTVAFDATNGFLLNGKPYTIKGTCNHQDHAGVGTAMPDALQYWRVARLKEMGCNAIRTSHNAPTPELLEACDRLGMLVMDENRRMDTNEYTLNELRSLVLRDRNHPGVFIWSLGNEEFYLQGRASGKITAEMAQAAAVRVVTAMQNVAHELDPTRRCTVAMNGSWGKGISTAIDVQGFNYHTGTIDGFREKFPEKPAIGTETASTRVTRGIYTDSKPNGYVAAYATNATERPWGWWPYYATHPFTSGGFAWTGFDYRGEPTPYKWPCINSHFGIMDMCGFPKDIYFYYQSWWQDKPVLHIMPHWNWPERIGQGIPVRVFSNCKEVELFLNGNSLGKQTMLTNWFLDWTVNYQAGVLSAKGYGENGKVIAESKIETAGAPVTVQLSPDRVKISADGQDLCIVNVSVADARGRVVPTADNLINFELNGPGKIIGVGNGDPSSHEADKADGRKVFCGYAQVIVQAGKKSGTMKLTATSPGLTKYVLEIQAESAPDHAVHAHRTAGTMRE